MSSKAFAAEPTFFDFDAAVKEAFCKATDKCESTYYTKTDSLKVETSNVKFIGEPKETNQDLLFMGDAELSNSDSKVTQNLNSDAFSQQYQDTFSSTVTEGWKVGGGLDITAQLSKALGLGFNANGEYSFSKSETQTYAKWTTYNSPAQNIKVPPRKKAIVKVNLQRVKGTGEASLDATIGGNVQYGNTIEAGFDEMPVYDLFKDAVSKGYQMPPQLSFDDQNKKLLFKGKGTWEADYGTKYLVDTKLEDLDTGKVETKKYSVPAEEGKK
ncbi:ETX/MTX2 family pore-forming toxin [Marininema mesophilum]|nr:ETX/MTX2 family pore-forming toxin [Marininema mesophilum]